MASFNDEAETGAFVELDPSFDAQIVQDLDVNSDEFKEFLVRLGRTIKKVSMVLNIKDSGYYVDTEFVNGQLFFPDPAIDDTTSTPAEFRQVFRKLINCGALKNNGSTTVAHGLTITADFSFTRIYGVATDPSTSFIPLPYAHVTDANNISLDVNATNVVITTGSDRTGYTTTYVVIEYIKS